jgi:hypothetical protein
MAVTGESEDFSHLDDPAFLAERARVRTELANQGDVVNRAELERLYDAMTEEFLTRASIAWSM